MVRFKIEVVMEKFGFSRSNAYSEFSSILKTAFNGGDFVQALNDALGGSSVSFTGLQSSEADSTFEVLTSASPTFAPTSDPSAELPTWVLPVVVVGGSLLVGMVLLALYCGKFNKGRNTKVYMAQGSNGDLDAAISDDRRHTFLSRDQKQMSFSDLFKPMVSKPVPAAKSTPQVVPVLNDVLDEDEVHHNDSSVRRIVTPKPEPIGDDDRPPSRFNSSDEGAFERVQHQFSADSSDDVSI